MSDSNPNMDEATPAENETPNEDATPKDGEAPVEEEKKKKNKNFSYFEPITGIIFAAVCTLIFLGFPEIITVVFVGNTLIPTFDEVVIRNMWVLVALWCLLHVGIDVVYLVQKYYSKNFVRFSVIGHAAALIFAAFIFIPHRIVNQDYIDFIYTYYADVAAWFGHILARPNLIILLKLIIIFIVQATTAVRRGRKAAYNKKNDDDEDAAQENMNEATADAAATEAPAPEAPADEASV